MYVEIARYTGIATLATCVVLAGCKAKDNSGMDTAAAMNSGTMMSDTSAAGAAAAAGTAVMTDANIAALVDEANAGDSSLAAAALPNLTNSGAKDFAKLMMGEHHALRVAGEKVFKDQNITPALPTPDPFKPAVEAEQTALAAMSKGAAYDSTYVAHEVGIHRAVIAWLGQHTPQNAAFQDYLKTGGPVLQKHLDHALALQKTLAGAKP